MTENTGKLFRSTVHDSITALDNLARGINIRDAYDVDLSDEFFFDCDDSEGDYDLKRPIALTKLIPVIWKKPRLTCLLVRSERVCRDQL